VTATGNPVGSGPAPGATGDTPEGNTANNNAHQLVFDDEFNGTAVSAPWQTLNGVSYGHLCYSNDPRHVSEGGGYLRLTATYDPGSDCGLNYEGGGVIIVATNWSYLYGTLKVRAKVPCQSGTGVWPGIWEYASQHLSNAYGEIDSLEIMDDHAGNTVSQSIHAAGLSSDPNPGATSLVYGSQAGWCGSFHVYGNTWTSSSVTFTIDGQTERVFSRSQFPAWPLTTPQAPVLSLGVGSYGGTPSPVTFPEVMLVDWVRIWS
jgi:beta-glucanase (GH16 family)